MGNPLKKIGKTIGKIFPGTGKSAAKRAEKQANAYAAEATAARLKTEEKTKREKLKAQKLAIRGMRSRRAASRYAVSDSQGSTTIG